MTHLTQAARRHPLAAFFLLALGFSWSVETPLAFATAGVSPFSVPQWLHYLAAFGPALAALAVSWVLGGAAVVRQLLAQAIRWRIGTRWLVVAVGSPIALFAAAAGAAHLVEGTWPDFTQLGEVNFLGAIGVPSAFLLWISTFGFGEEIGWRGFALPRLQQRHGALKASLLLAMVWAVWHVPAFFYLPTYMRLGVGVIPGFVVGLTLGAILLTWLYNSTGGSVLAVAIWHALFDFFSATEATDGLMNAVMSTVVMFWAIAIVILCDRSTLTAGRARRTSHAR